MNRRADYYSVGIDTSQCGGSRFGTE